MDHSTLTEQLQHWQERVTIDAQRRLVRNVALAGSASRNGYEYTEESLRDGARLYLRKPVFLDHSANRGRTLERSTRDLVGSIVEATFEEGQIRGDIEVLETEAGETFLKLVASQTPGVGMSHVVVAQRSLDGKRVDRIVEVLSVDAVINPATTSTFQESVPAEHLAHEQQLTALREECGRLEIALAESQRRERGWRLLLDSGLPASALTACFKEQVLACADEQQCRELLADRAWCAGSGSRSNNSVVLSRQRVAEGAQAGDALFVSAIRRR